MESETREPDTHEIKECPTCGYPHMAPIGAVFVLPGDEVQTMADAANVLNANGHRNIRTWVAYRDAFGAAVVANGDGFTEFNEFEAVAIARRIKREKGA